MTKLGYINVISVILSILLSVSTFLHTDKARAAGLKAGTVLDVMNSKEKNAYFTGIIEGLAYARFVRDGKRSDGGMKCVYDWYFEKKGTFKTILVAFRKFKTYRGNAIIGALVARECGN